MNDKDYAISNLRCLAESVSAFASYADDAVSDSYELYKMTAKVEKAVRALANWIEKH